MSDLYIKEMPDNTVALITESGHIIGKFDDIDDTSDIIYDWQEPPACLANTAQPPA